MAETTTTLKIKAVDEGAIATVNDVTARFTNLTVASSALNAGLAGLNKVAASNVGQFILGSENANKLSASISKLTDVNSKALKSFSALADIGFLGGQALTFAKGVQDAAAVYARIPQAFALFQASGVSTRSIEDFYELTDAIRGSEVSLESFAISAVQNLGRFEQAAARAGTILKSSTRFSESGVAENANAVERMQNAFEVQNIVNRELNNTVKSTDALLGQYEVLSSGFTKAADSQQVLTAGLKLTGIGQAGGQATDPGETLRLLGKTLNAYQQSSSEAAKTAAVLNAVVENGITTIPELSQGFGQTATTARAAGIALNDLAAGTAVLTTQGINTATALTGLQRVAGAIIDKTPEAQKALDKLSLNGQKIRFDQAEVQAKGFTQALIDLNTAAGGNVKVLQEIFPEEIAFRTVLGLLAQDGQKLQSVLQSVSTANAASLDKVFEGATGDRISRFEQIANKFQELIIKIAASVAPVFEPGIEALSKIAQVFSDLPEPVKKLIGEFIAFQLTNLATSRAVDVLFQTMLTLGSTYMQVRLFSLLLSGQLSTQVGIIRQLIIQKKGLGAAILQLIGFDQRYRLGVEATTEAIKNQGIIGKATAAVQAKAGNLANKVVTAATGVDFGQIKEQGKKAVAEVATVAKNVALGVGEATGAVSAVTLLDQYGNPLNATGFGRVKEEATKVKDAIADAVSPLLAPDGSALQGNLKERVGSAINATKEEVGKLVAGSKQAPDQDADAIAKQEEAKQRLAKAEESKEQASKLEAEAATVQAEADKLKQQLEADARFRKEYQEKADLEERDAQRAQELRDKASANIQEATALEATQLPQIDPEVAKNNQAEIKRKQAIADNNNKLADDAAKRAAAMREEYEKLVKEDPLLQDIKKKDRVTYLETAEGYALDGERTFREQADNELREIEKLRGPSEFDIETIKANQKRAKQLRSDAKNAELEANRLTFSSKIAGQQSGRAEWQTLSDDDVNQIQADLEKQLDLEKELKGRAAKLREEADAEIESASKDLPLAPKDTDEDAIKKGAIRKQKLASVREAKAKSLRAEADTLKQELEADAKLRKEYQEKIDLEARDAQKAQELRDKASANNQEAEDLEFGQTRANQRKAQRLRSQAQQAEQEADRLAFSSELAGQQATITQQKLLPDDDVNQMKSDLEKKLEREKKLKERAAELRQEADADIASSTPKLLSPTEAAEIEVLVRQEEAVKKLAEAKKLTAEAINEEAIAKEASNRVDDIAKQLQQSPDDEALKAALIQQETIATNASTKANQLRAAAEVQTAAATELNNAANVKAILAEQGLAETRIFGRSVLFSTQGLMGAINVLLVTEFKSKTLVTFQTKVLAAAQTLLNGTMQIFGAILKGNILLGLKLLIGGMTTLAVAIKGAVVSSFTLLKTSVVSGYTALATMTGVIKGGLIAGLSLLKGGIIGVGKAIGGVMAFLGPVGILIGAVAAGVLVLKENFFGLGSSANKAAQGLKAIATEEANLAKKFGTQERLLKFKTEIKEGDVESVETRLNQLNLSGDLTTSQFNKLRETLNSVATSGKLAGDGLEKFKNELEAIRQGAEISGREKGFSDYVGGFFGATGKFLLNAPAAIAEVAAYPVTAVASLFGLGNANTLGKVRANREADSTTQARNELRSISEAFGNANLGTAQQVSQFKQAQGLTEETNKKIAAGINLGGEDFEREKILFEGRKQRNELLINQFDQQIEQQQKYINALTDPALKSSMQGQLDSVIAQRDALEKRNEALKQGNEEFTKYYAEILPGLKRAITETTNFQQALSSAEASFNQVFKLDASGKATAYFKDISTLRNEAQQLQSQILENYETGAFESGGNVAELEVVRRLTQVRDNKITLADGTSGFRLSLGDRMAATQQIIDFEQAASKQRDQALKLDGEKIKLQQQQRVISTKEAEKQIAKIQLQGIQETLIQKETEIKQYAQFPVRKAQLEREAAAIRVQIEQAVANESNRILERQTQRRQEALNIEMEQVKVARADRLITEQEAQKQLAELEIKAAKNRLNNLVDDFRKSGNTDSDLYTKTRLAALQIRQQELALAERDLQIEDEKQKRILANSNQERVLSLQGQASESEFQVKNFERRQQLVDSLNQFRTVSLQASELELQLQIKGTKDLEKQAQLDNQIAENKLRNLLTIQLQERESLVNQEKANKLNFEREAIQLRIQKIQNEGQISELEAELVRAERDKKTPEEIKTIELQIEAAKQQADLLNKQGEQLSKNLTQQAQILANSRRELEVKQEIAKNEAVIEFKQRAINKQVEIIKSGAEQINLAGQIQIQQAEGVGKAYEHQKSVLQSTQNLVKSRVDVITGELQLASQLTNSEGQKKKIAISIAAIKMRSLERQLSFEEKVLNINLAQQASQLEQEKIRNRVAVANSKAAIAQAQADLASVQLDPKATPQQVQAAQLNVQAKVEEAIAAQYAGVLLNRQAANQGVLAEIERQQFKQNANFQRSQAQADFASATGKRSIMRRTREQLLNRASGGMSFDAIGNALDILAGQEPEGSPGLRAFRREQSEFVLGRLGLKMPPPLQLQFPDFEQFRKNQLSRFAEFGYQMPNKTSPQDLTKQGQQAIVAAIQKLDELVDKLGSPNQVEVTANITNNFNSADKSAGNTVVSQIRSELKDILLKVQQK